MNFIILKTSFTPLQKIALACFIWLWPLLFLSPFLKAQNTGIGSVSFIPNASAMLEIQAGGLNNKGLLIPRITNVQRLAMNPLPAAAQGLLVYQSDIVGVSLEGFYYNISTTVTPNWVYLSPGAGSGWSLTGNAGTVAGTNFIGTTDVEDWVIKTGNIERARVFGTGEVRINTAIANAGEVFTVLGDGVAGATNAIGADAINGYSTDLGTGVYGQNTGNGTGVWGKYQYRYWRKRR